MYAVGRCLRALGVWAVASGVGQSAQPAVAEVEAQHALSAAISRLVQNSIPLQYEKQKDWGATKEISVLRRDGKGLATRLKIKKRPVEHGVWKHYRLRLVEPQKNLRVELADLRPQGPGRAGFTLHITALVDAWARAKVYQYGIHIIALEMESDVAVALRLDGELGMHMGADAKGPAFFVTPSIAAAQLHIERLDLRRISNADGPIVHELGDGLRSVIEDELNGPKLVEKLNRSIEKQRDQLTFRPEELLPTTWRPTPLNAASELASPEAPSD